MSRLSTDFYCSHRKRGKKEQASEIHSVPQIERCKCGFERDTGNAPILEASPVPGIEHHYTATPFSFRRERHGSQ
ncbi:hypothetical protein DPMN_138982 [Dreissena polymorpha]|uniref:Uncharacterized protein n=1 Tax=Dreissena polymorpha TaxID=45954 RepID=A0A9D4JHR8_DREPO|nr:hypothetical protein DPMN_138982 [Dreissena polymorpha]